MLFTYFILFFEIKNLSLKYIVRYSFKNKHMKKTLLSSLLLFSVVLTNAQNKTLLNNTKQEPTRSFKRANVSAFKNTASSINYKPSNALGSAWFNLVDYLEFVNPGVQVFSAMHIFPDSAIVLGYTTGNQPVNPFIHKAATYMDPSFMAQQTIITDKQATYVLDSISVGYIYERNTGTSNNTADSVIFQVIAENHSLDYTLTGGGFSYQDIEYNFSTLEVKNTMTILKRVAVPLKYADTCSGSLYKQIKIATPGIAPFTNSKKVGVVISFKPGYTYTPTDILIGDGTNIATKNLFMIYSSEQNGDGNGAGTDPTYNGIVGDFTSDMNMSYVLQTDVRYNLSPGNWNGYFIPTYVYTTPFSYESHDIGFKLTCTSVGIKELEKDGFALTQNQPNPFTKESTINYQLSKDASTVLFNITDVTGRIISSEKVSGNQGSHTIKLGAYASGLYYYSLIVDGKPMTKKMIVQ